MLYPSINLLRTKADSKYTLVSLAAKRARDLIDGKPPLVHLSIDRPVSIATQEIAEDLITYTRDFSSEDEAEMLADRNMYGGAAIDNISHNAQTGDVPSEAAADGHTGGMLSDDESCDEIENEGTYEEEDGGKEPSDDDPEADGMAADSDEDTYPSADSVTADIEE